MPSFLTRRQDRPEEKRRRSSSWSHSYQRKSSRHQPEDDDDSAYLNDSDSDCSSTIESESEEESVEHVHRRHTISHTKSGHSENECQLDATNTPFLELDEVTVKLNCDDPHLGI